jgi:hypothetical protein
MSPSAPGTFFPPAFDSLPYIERGISAAYDWLPTFQHGLSLLVSYLAVITIPASLMIIVGIVLAVERLKRIRKQEELLYYPLTAVAEPVAEVLVPPPPTTVAAPPVLEPPPSAEAPALAEPMTISRLIPEVGMMIPADLPVADDEALPDILRKAWSKPAEKSATTLTKHFIDSNVVREFQDRFKVVLQHADSEQVNDWRQAIIEADILLNDMLSAAGYDGQSFGDKIRQLDRERFSVQKVSEAHATRNQIAHAGSAFMISKHEANRSISAYRQLFRELGVLQEHQ